MASVLFYIKVSLTFSVIFPGSLVSSTNKIARHDIAEILLKVVLNTIMLTLKFNIQYTFVYKTYNCQNNYGLLIKEFYLRVFYQWSQ